MKERPILFSTEMVQAILQGRKTQTRRSTGLEDVNVNIEAWDMIELKKNYSNTKVVAMFERKGSESHPLPQRITQLCPYGKIGDVLWVRETWFNCNKFKEAPLFYDKSDYLYKADDAFIGDHKWKPSIHMPREACRIKLRITNIRVERLQDISQEDAILEGVEKQFSSLFNEWRFKDYADVKSVWRYAVSSFQSLWSSLYGINSWDDNPWVWVIEFEKL